MVTVYCASIAIIVVVKIKNLELWVLRDKWLVTHSKVNLQLGSNLLVITKAMSRRAMLSNVTASRLAMQLLLYKEIESINV